MIDGARDPLDFLRTQEFHGMPPALSWPRLPCVQARTALEEDMAHELQVGFLFFDRAQEEGP